MTLSCIVCDVELDSVNPNVENQPYGGTTFKTYGHYGSTAFDPTNNSFLEINICDTCLKFAGTREKVLINEISVVKHRSYRFWNNDEL